MEAKGPTMIAKKLRNMVRRALFTVQKGVFNSKKRGKALTQLMLEHHSNLGCQSQNVSTSFVSPVSCRPSNVDLTFVSPISCRPSNVDLAFVSPREYEFSCSSSPTYGPYKGGSSKTTHNPRKRRHARYYHMPPYVWRDESGGGGGDDGGGGMSPLVAFHVRDSGDSGYLVDMEAERFIQQFYRELRLQKWMATQESTRFNY